MKTIRIGGGAGYGGDRIEPALNLIRHGQLDYIIFECLAERTIALAQQRKMKDPAQGYNEFLEYRMSRILPLLKAQMDRGQQPVKIITNMGAANPEAALKVVTAMAGELELCGSAAEDACAAGSRSLKIAAVIGDNVTDRIAQYRDLPILETGQPLSAIEDKVISANAYIGAEGIVKALEAGADIVITGRVADPALVLAPLIHEFGWAMDDYDKLGKGTAAGHLLECGAQVCGGYFADPGYKDVPDIENQGFPIAEVTEDGRITITKLAEAGGLVTKDTVTEQLIYEIHDPAQYFTPDVAADFSNVWLEEEGNDRVVVHDASGREPNGLYKVSVGYRDGFIGEGEMSYGGSGCAARAKLAGQIIRHRLEPYKDDIQEMRIDLIGVNSLYGAGCADQEDYGRSFGPGAESGCVGGPALTPGEPAECRLRVALRTEDKAAAALAGDEVEALYTNGPAGGGGARKYLRQVVSVASVFIPRSDVAVRVIMGSDGWNAANREDDKVVEADRTALDGKEGE